MTKRVVVHPAAAHDAAQAYAWYEQRSHGLGDRFQAALRERVDSIAENPDRFELVCDPYRRGLVKGFPYGVFFEVQEDAILIHAVFHCSQDPAKLAARLPEHG